MIHSYPRALIGAAVALVAVIALYLGLVGAVIGLTAWHLLAHAHWFQVGASGLGGYAVGGIVGTLVALFLVKPLFSRRPTPPPSRAITHEEHPRLFQFIGAICQEVGARPPSRVDVDCSVNASVGFRQGWSSIAEGDLTLTLGLPLIAGPSARGFGGVLAHEFGHFNQEAGLRLTYVVRLLSDWLWRVVHERDALDEHLAEAIENAGVFLAFPLHLAHGGIWVSRRFLWVLMLLGHAACCRLLRQMEFDADQEEARVAGSETFAHTSQRLRLLHVGWQRSRPLLTRAWRERRLPDDLATYIRHLADSLPEETRNAVEETARNAKTGTFDTHPCDAEREAAALAVGAPGKIDVDEPAPALFSDFSTLCREVTREHYTQVLGFEPEAGRLEAVEAATASVDDENTGQRVAESYAPGVGHHGLALPWSEFLPHEPASVADLHATIAGLRVELDAATEAQEWQQTWLRARMAEHRVHAARQLTAAAIQWDAAALALPSTEADTLEVLAQRSLEQRESMEVLLKPLVVVVAHRLHAALLLWWHDRVVIDGCPETPAVREEILGLVPILGLMSHLSTALSALESDHDAFHLILISGDRCRNHETGHDVLHELASRLRRQLRLILPRLSGVQHPFLSRAGTLVTIQESVRRESTEADGFHGAESESVAVRRIVPDLYARAFGRLVALGYEAERRARIGG